MYGEGAGADELANYKGRAQMRSTNGRRHVTLENVIWVDMRERLEPRGSRASESGLVVLYRQRDRITSIPGLSPEAALEPASSRS